MPLFLNWKEFSDYYLKMRNLGIIHSMKDIYWDIRPKPKFGTVEVRICDTPLTLMRAIVIIAYAQTLARYLLLEKPLPFTKDLFMIYNSNRFQACRYGYEGNFIDPHHLSQHTIREDILSTVKLLKPHAAALNTENYLRTIHSLATNRQNDAAYLRNIFSKSESFEKMVQNQCQLWLEQFYVKKLFI